jgi:hypothetical protein
MNNMLYDSRNIKSNNTTSYTRYRRVSVACESFFIIFLLFFSFLKEEETVQIFKEQIKQSKICLPTIHFFSNKKIKKNSSDDCSVFLYRPIFFGRAPNY